MLVYIDDKRRFIVKLRSGSILGTDKGFIRHDDIIGKKYGDIVRTSRGVRAYILKPILPDYLHSFKRATQVIYPKDSAFMIYMSGIGPGSRVLEAGVGTGFLTLSLANIVGDEGLVIGYDVNPRHLETARRNLENAGVLHRVVLKQGDVRKGIQETGLDAAFLDIPDPWNALETIIRSLKPSSPVLTYIPTVNQVEKTVLAMRKRKCFTMVEAVEILLREYSVEENATRPRTLMIGHTGYIVYGRTLDPGLCLPTT